MNRSIVIIIVAGIVVLLVAGAVFIPLPATAPESSQVPLALTSPLPNEGSSTILPETISPAPRPAPQQPPVADFAARITKKPFGIFITPQNSPVQPERFSGYHTGVDIEYDDVTKDVPITAVAGGTVLQSRTASGYGGVVAIQHELNGESIVAIYGHLDPQSLVAVNTTVEAGQQIGVLGDDKSNETDGERKHLHFALLPGTTVNLRGYVQNKAELSAWRNPLELFQ